MSNSSITDPRPFTSFKLFGQTYKVVLDPNLQDTTGNIGETSEGRSEIRIQAPDRNCSTEYQQITFWHEAVHAILCALGEEKLNKNEKFVDLFGRGIHQILTTGRAPRST